MAGGGIPQYMDVTPRVTQLDKFASDVNKVVGLVEGANKNISKQGTKFNPFRIDTTQISRNLASVTSQFTNMWQNFDARSNVLSNFGNQLTQIGRSIRYFAFDFERLGRTLTVGLTVPLVAAGTAIVKWGSDFEQSLRKVEVLVNQNRDTVARWGREILTTMAGLGQSPNELAEGLFFAASAFGSMADKAPVMEVLRSAAAGATIGLGEMDDVTRLLTASINAYGAENLGAAEAMYILIQTVTEGNFQADKLATSLGRVLGSATALKIPFRDLVTYIAGITRIGEDPSRIITSLNSALLKMLNPTSKAQKILEQYGYTLGEVKARIGQPGGLLDLLNEFRDTMSDQAFGQLFTNRAVRTALVATDALRAEMGQISSEMTESEKKRLKEIETFQKLANEGMIGDYAKMMLERLEVDKFYADQLKRLVVSSTDTVKGQTKIMRDTIQSIGIGAFQSVVQKPLLEFLKTLNQQLLTFNQVVSQNPKTISLILKLGAGLAALGPGVIIVSRLVQSLTVFTNVAGLAFRALGYLGGTAINIVVKGLGLVGTVTLTAVRAFLPLLSIGTQVAVMIGARLIPALAAYGAQAAFAVFRTVSMTSAMIASKISIAALSGTISFFTGVLSVFNFVGSVTSTVVAGIASLFAIVGGPAIAAAAAVGGLVAGFSALLVAGGKVRQVIKPLAGKIGGAFDSLRKESADWGEGLMATYSNGIIRGAAYVVRALTSIANIITGLLRPKSPPKILPEIDMWGKGTMEAWLEGWGKADFGILRTIMDDVGSYLKSVLDFSEDDNKEGIVAQMVLGSQKSIIDAINQVKQTGQIAKDALQNIFDSLGTTTPALQGYIRSQFQVAAATNKLTVAQEKLNKVTKYYENALKPLQRRLDDINRIQDERSRKEREQELKDLLDTEIPDEIRTAAMLELEEIGIERQISNLQQAQANAEAPLEDQVSIAEQELEAAQKQLEYYEGLMGLQENQANLLKDIADMLDEVKDELKKLKEKLGEELYGPGTPIEPGELADFGDLGGIDITGDITGEFDKQIASLMEEVEGLKEAWGGVWDAVNERWNTFSNGPLANIITKMRNFKDNVLVPVGETLGKGMDRTAMTWDFGMGQLEDPGLDWSILGVDENGQTFPEYWNSLLSDAFGDMTWQGALQSAIDNVNEILLPSFFQFIQDAIDMKNAVGDAFLQMGADFQNFMTLVQELAGNGKKNFEQMKSDISAMYEGVKESWNNFKENFIGVVDDIKEGLFGVKDESNNTRSGFGTNTLLMGIYASRFKLTFEGVKRAIVDAITDLVEKFQEWWDQLVELYDYIEVTFSDALEDVVTLIGDIGSKIEDVIGWFEGLVETIKTFIEEGVNKLTSALSGEGGVLAAFTAIGDYVSTTLTNIFNTFLSLIESVISRIATALSDAARLAATKLGFGDDSGSSQNPTGGGNPPSGNLPEAFGFTPLAAEAVTGYNSSYPVNTSPFRNMPSVGATGAIASAINRGAANDHSVSVVVAPGGSAVMDGGVVVNFGDVHISNGMDYQEFTARVERVITDSVTR